MQGRSSFASGITIPNATIQQAAPTTQGRLNFNCSAKFSGMPNVLEPTHQAVLIFQEGDLEILEDKAYTPTRYFVMYKDRRVGSRIKIYKNHLAFCRMVLKNAASTRRRIAKAYATTIARLEKQANNQLQFADLFESQAKLIPPGRKSKCPTPDS